MDYVQGFSSSQWEVLRSKKIQFGKVNLSFNNQFSNNSFKASQLNSQTGSVQKKSKTQNVLTWWEILGHRPDALQHAQSHMLPAVQLFYIA